MTAHVWRHCDKVTEDPDDAVYVAHEPGSSGPGWDIWARRAHVDHFCDRTRGRRRSWPGC
jgi:hypothetical protein